MQPSARMGRVDERDKRDELGGRFALRLPMTCGIESCRPCSDCMQPCVDGLLRL